MLELPHVLIGATIATKIGNPFFSFPLAFLSNFLLDLLPHWNPHLSTEMERNGQLSPKTKLLVVTDSFLGIIIGSLLAARFYPNWGRVFLVLFGCFFAVLADLLEAPYFFFGWRNKYILKLISLQRKLQWNVPPVPGVLSQVILIGILLFILFS